MKRLGNNHGGYHGETIEIRTVLCDVESAARERGWTSETFLVDRDLRWLAFHKAPSRTTDHPPRIYISAGIHGDEPAGPLAALKLIRENRWPESVEIFLLPCLNPIGFTLNRRENAGGSDLNRDYRHLETAEVRAHIAWLDRQPRFDVTICLHEDWESHGFYVYELNPDHRPSLAERIVKGVASVCPIDLSPLIEGREVRGGIINPNLDPATRPQWPEAFWLVQNKTRQSYTLESPSDFPLATRVDALVAGVNAAIPAGAPIC